MLRFEAPEEDDYVLHERWQSVADIVAAHRDHGLRIDLGSGYAKPEGFVGIDNLSGERTQVPNAANAPDILMNLNRSRFPFADGSVDEVRSSHFLEHSELDHVIDESHRVLRDDGIFLFAVPYANSAEGMYPGHLIFLTEKWFYENLNFQAKFQIVDEVYTPSDDWLALPRMARRIVPFRYARRFLFNACSQMIITARKKPRA
jgi:SAM-dependent methyltransferase